MITQVVKTELNIANLTRLAIAGCRAIHTRQTNPALTEYNPQSKSHGSVQYMTLTLPDGVMVCFAGLNELTDILSLPPSNITIPNIGKLNANALFTIHDLQINQPIKAITGYSLGGVYAIYYALINNLNIPVFTFGTPRCVGLDTKVLLKTKLHQIYQHCIKGDPVVHSPLIGSWYHPTQPQVIDQVDNEWVLLSSDRAWQDTLNEITFNGLYNSFLAVIYLLIKSAIQSNSKHAIDAYYKAIISLL